MINYRKILGDLGEKLVVMNLEKSEHNVLVTKYRTIYGEVDIVSHENNNFHFIEVKTVLIRDVSRETLMRPEDHMNFTKINRLKNTATVFMDEFGLYDENSQIDLFCVYVSKSFLKGHKNNDLLEPIRGIDYDIVCFENIYI